jgi:hypothetical protein
VEGFDEIGIGASIYNALIESYRGYDSPGNEIGSQ